MILDPRYRNYWLDLARKEYEDKQQQQQQKQRLNQMRRNAAIAALLPYLKGTANKQVPTKP